MTLRRSTQRAISLTERLEKLADSDDQQIASKAVSDLTTLHISETEAANKARIAELEAKGREEKIAPLRAEILELKKKLAGAEELQTPLTAERDALLTEVSGLREQAAKAVPLETELATLRTGNEEWKAEQTKLLTADAQAQRFKAERSERNAKEVLNSAISAFGREGMQLMLNEFAKLVSEYNIPQPALATLPSGISPAFLTLWGNSLIKSKYMLSYAASYKEPNEGFQAKAVQLLTANLPTWGTVAPHQNPDEPLRFTYEQTPEVQPDLGVQKEVVLEMMRQFGCEREIQQRVDQRQAEVLGRQFLENNRALAAQEQDLVRQDRDIQEKERTAYDDLNSTLRLDQRNSLANLDGGKIEEF